MYKVLSCRLGAAHPPECDWVGVRGRWIMATQTYPACTISDKNNQLDDCGCST